jgi:hypothetical protein
MVLYRSHRRHGAAGNGAQKRRDPRDGSAKPQGAVGLLAWGRRCKAADGRFNEGYFQPRQLCHRILLKIRCKA